MSRHVVVVGSGIAGLSAAWHAGRAGARVTVVTKAALDQANTRYAQGGIAGVTSADDSVAAHIADTLAAGAGLCDPRAVTVLATEGPDRIRELIEAGVAFDRDPDGRGFVRGLEAAHSVPRILHAGGDATGASIERALVARLRAGDARVIERAFLVDLLRDGAGVVGVDLLRADGARELVTADAVILATGGAGRLFSHTTNPPVATADGLAAAMRAGARTADLEFFQFHPTVLAVGEPFLVSEAVRGEGATLLDESGRRFAFDAHPAGELAPRDVVARAIAQQMERQGGRPVRLDATAVGAPHTAQFLARRFPTIDAAMRERGLDWAREPVPVTPAAHYYMGGVATDLRGRTSLPGLYAAGEVARTGVHGANRLASNSLLEGAVFGARAGADAALPAGDGFGPGAVPAPADAAARPPAPDRTAPGFTRSRLQELMWQDAGVLRDAAGLDHAAGILAAWSTDPPAGADRAAREDRNLIAVASALIAAASARRHSVGAHFRRDDPDPASPAVRVGAVTGTGS